MKFEVIIIGGGLAGLCSALHLSLKRVKVLVIEKYQYPKHKVCGEYISNEVLPYLKSLGFNPYDFGAKAITELTFSTKGNQSIRAKLPLGGFGISRYCIDSELAKCVKKAGAEILHARVTEIQFIEDHFVITTNQKENYQSDFVIGAYGKRSNLDVNMERPFIQKRSPYLGVKAHFEGDFPDNEVGLHNFEGGYCGISNVEDGKINVCYLVDYQTFKKYRSIEDFQVKVLTKNKFLKEALSKYKLAFDHPISISQISFLSKSPVENHILMCGDSAGMIHPLAGNGMGMAIRSAQVLSDLFLQFKVGIIKTRAELENNYQLQWNMEFSTRLKYGHIISRAFRMGLFSEIMMGVIKICPPLLQYIVKKTHGKPMKAIS